MRRKMQKLGLKVTGNIATDRAYMTSYLTLIETMHLSCTVFKLLSLISQTLKMSRDRDHAHSRDSL